MIRSRVAASSENAQLLSEAKTEGAWIGLAFWYFDPGPNVLAVLGNSLALRFLHRLMPRISCFLPEIVIPIEKDSVDAVVNNEHARYSQTLASFRPAAHRWYSKQVP
jgi:hypothetical protein